jgi:hypothetical protein
VYDGPGDADTPSDLFIDENSNVYVTGTSMQSSASGSEEYVTIKYNSAGAQQWVKLYNGPGGGYDGSNALAVDSAGNVFVTGISSESGTSYDYATIKYSSSGNEIWVNRYSGAGNNLNFGTSIKVDNIGHLYTAGGTGSSALLNFGLLAYNPDGTQQWFTDYNADDDSLYTRPLLSVDNEGSIYAAGSTHESGTDYRYVLIKYAVTVPVELTSFTASSLNNEVLLNWSTATETNNLGFEIQRRSASPDYNWANIGFLEGNGTTIKHQNYSFIDKDLSSGKYQYRLKQTDLDGSFKYSKVIEADINVPGIFLLSQNYPNPFNPSTSIYYSLSNDGMVTLKVYDVLGEEVLTLVNQNQKAGAHSVNFNGINLPSGVYVYRLQSGIYSSSKKMILLR